MAPDDPDAWSLAESREKRTRKATERGAERGEPHHRGRLLAGTDRLPKMPSWSGFARRVKQSNLESRLPPST